MGRLPFVGGRLFAQLAAEAEQQRPDGEPGSVLARLAVSRQLREAVSEAMGCPVVPTYEALYQYHATVPPHRDKEGWDLTFHMVVAGDGSVLEAYDDAGAVSRRFEVAVGESVVLRGQAVTHAWAPADSSRILIATGFRPA